MAHGNWKLRLGRPGWQEVDPLHGFGDHNKLRDLCVLVSSPVKWEE
jgi:hypothetical protein